MNWRQTIRSIQENKQDAFYLISHASYILRTGGMLWAVDPRLTLENHSAADDSLSADLAGLQAVLLTHLHVDHYDEKLINTLAFNDILWLFPAFMPSEQQETWKSRLKNCLFVKPGDRIRACGLDIRVSDSIHYDIFEGKKVGVPEIGYRVTVCSRTLAFPGDIRSYGTFPEEQKNADELFAHVWLGRQAALHPRQEMIEAFSRYFADSKARRIWLTHLNDMHRPPADRWTVTHAECVREKMLQIVPGLSVEIPEPGEEMRFSWE